VLHRKTWQDWSTCFNFWPKPSLSPSCTKPSFCFFFYVLVGKRVDAVQKQWQQIFVEAAWHQPSVILFDDLDQIVSAPSALQEMGGEAVYKRRLAQGERSSNQYAVFCFFLP